MNEMKAIACIIAAITGSQVLWFLDALGAGACYYQYGWQDALLALLAASAVWVVFTLRERAAGNKQEKPVIKMYKPKKSSRADRIA